MDIANSVPLLQQQSTHIPKEFLLLIADYQKYPQAFGTYGSQSFAEWFAEGFKTYVNGAGNDFPISTRLFFDNAAKREPGKECNSCHKSWKN